MNHIVILDGQFQHFMTNNQLKLGIVIQHMLKNRNIIQ